MTVRCSSKQGKCWTINIQRPQVPILSCTEGTGAKARGEEQMQGPARVPAQRHPGPPTLTPGPASYPHPMEEPAPA